MNPLVLSSALTTHVPAPIIQAGERTGVRFSEHFRANIRNHNTRRAYDTGPMIFKPRVKRRVSKV